MPMLKKILCGICAAACAVMSFAAFSGCGEAQVNFTLSEDGTYYILSGVSGNKSALREYEVPATYSPEEGATALPVKEIGAEAFMGCTRLRDVLLTDNITKIGDRAFMQCIFQEFIIPDSVTYIGYGAFGMCDSLKEIVIPKSVEVLAPLAFAYCSDLQLAVVNANISVLNERVFINSVVNSGGNIYTNTSLTQIYLPSTLEKIYYNALSGNAITDIYYAGSQEQWDELYFFRLDPSEEQEGEFVEVVLDKYDVMTETVAVHFNAEYSPE